MKSTWARAQSIWVVTAFVIPVFGFLPPNWLRYPEPTFARKGDRVSFQCQADRNEFIVRAHVQLADGSTPTVNNVSGDWVAYLSLNQATVTILSLSKRTEGSYYCQGINPTDPNKDLIGPKRSFTVAVAPSPQLFPPLVVVVAENDAASVTCAFKGVPAPNVALYRATKKLAMNDGGLLTYVFSNVQRSDGDNYQCVAVNVAGSSKRTFKLSVEYKPRILTTTHATTSVVKGMPAVFHCIADALPVSVYFWLHNGTSIGRTVVNKNVTLLVVMVLSFNDTGKYWCIATNSLGEDRRDFQLLMKVPPGPPSKPYAVQIGIHYVTITWNPGFDGHGTISEYEVQYRKVNSDHWTKTRVQGMSATLTSLAPNEPFFFKIKAVNEVGKGLSGPQSDEVITHPLALPKVERVYISNVKPTLFSVYWQAPRDLNASHGEIRSYTVRYYSSGAGIAAAKYQNTTGSATSANLTDLARETGYIVDVAASNRIFTGPYSDSAFTKTTGLSGDGAAGTAGLSGGGVAGIAVGCVALVAIIILCLKSKKGSKESSRAASPDNTTKEMTNGSLYAEVVTMSVSKVVQEPIRLTTNAAYQSSSSQL